MLWREISEYVDWEAFQAGVIDAHGNITEGWADPLSVPIYAFDPGSSSEPRDGGARVIVEPTIYMPPSPVFGSRDRVTRQGKRFQVEGEAREWTHPTDPTREANVVTLRRVDG